MINRLIIRIMWIAPQNVINVYGLTSWKNQSVDLELGNAFPQGFSYSYIVCL